MRLSHGHNNFHTFTGLCQRQEGARNRSAVHGDALHALLHGVGVLHPDVVHGTPVTAGDGVACQRVGDAGVNAQAVQSGLDAQNVLAHVHEGPCRRAGQPAVLGLAEGGGIAARHHLAVNVGFGAVDLADVLDIGRAGLFVDSKGPVTVAQHGLSTADPWVVVAEDTGVLLVARGIAGDLAQIEPVGGVGGLEQYHAVRGVQPLLHALQCGFGLTGLSADPGHHAHALGFDEDLPLVAFPAAYGGTKGIVGTAEPCAVPAGGQGGLFYCVNGGAGTGGLLGEVQVVTEFGVLAAIFHEHARNKYALSHRALAGAGDLEALARVLREAVQVQAVVPVGPADQRQAVGAQMGMGVAEAPVQMLHQGLCSGHVVVKETMSDFASGESSMNAAIENEDYKNEGEIAAEEGITSENGLDGQVVAGRKLIRTVYLSLQTTEFDSVLSNLSEKTAELGGYIENSSVSGHSYYYNNTRYASYTIRIPTAELNQFVDVVSEIGNVTQKNESVEDVTLQYVDVESRKKALETEQERLMELLSSAENMEDLLAIESKLSEVRYELENYGSQLRMLDNQIDYSTVNVDVDEVERITETGEKSFFAEIKDRFGDSLYQVGRGIRSFVIGFLGSLPIIFVWVVIAAVVVIVVP